MLRKRLVFTLLYSDGNFVLSRNFRLQNVGNIGWLKRNYDFSKISFAIDELIVLDVTRGERDFEKFCDVLKQLSDGCFIPIAAGGGVRSSADARSLLRSGADKVVVNSILFENQVLLNELAQEFGEQCIVGSIDVTNTALNRYEIRSRSGTNSIHGDTSVVIDSVLSSPIGELYINSIDRDGTGQGYDLGLLDLLPRVISKPIIIAGGVGNSTHFRQGLLDPRVDAAATAHLFNFIGDGLINARYSLIQSGVNLPNWIESKFIVSGNDSTI